MWRCDLFRHPGLIVAIGLVLGGCQQNDPVVTRPPETSAVATATTGPSATPPGDGETLPNEIPPSTEPVAAIRQAPLIRIDPQVTKIVAPLDADGYPDYLGAYEAAHSGIEPSKNIIAGLRELLGQQELPEEAVEEYSRKLGVTLARPGDAFFQTISLRPTFIAVKGNRELTKEEAEQLAGTKVQQQLSEAQARPWSREEFPEVYSWIATNEGILPQIQAACHRPDIYMPIVAGSRLIDIELDHIAINQFTTYLSAYAMLKAHEGDRDRAIDALVSLGLLGRRVMEMPEEITFLRGVGARAMADQLLLLAIRQPNITAEQLTRLGMALEGLHPPAIDVSQFVEWNRMRFLDAICKLVKEIQDKPAARKLKASESLVVANEYFDRFSMNPTKEEFHEIRAELEEMAEEVRQEILAAFPDPSKLKSEGGLRGPGLVQLAEYLSKPERLLFLSVLPGFLSDQERMSSVLDRDLCRHRLLTLGVQALLYQAKNNAIPDSLERLGSEELRSDPYSGQPFLMKIDEDSIVIYSVAENGIDDGGEDDLWLKEDMGVRVPKIHR